jgi:hypothetical protein
MFSFCSHSVNPAINGMGGPSHGRRTAEVRAAADAAREAQRKADQLACTAWNIRMKEGGPAQPSPSLRAAVNSGFRFLCVQCSGCKQRAYVDLESVRRPAGTPIWRLERSLACDLCRAKNSRAPGATLERLTRQASPGT